jgi:uroporphyrinogen-III synthase
MVEIARRHGREAQLRDGLSRTRIASIGPVVSEELRSQGLRTDITPDNKAYFMRPLISAMEKALSGIPRRHPAPR